MPEISESGHAAALMRAVALDFYVQRINFSLAALGSVLNAQAKTVGSLLKV